MIKHIARARYTCKDNEERAPTHLTARARTKRSKSRPFRIMSSTESRCVMRVTSCSPNTLDIFQSPRSVNVLLTTFHPTSHDKTKITTTWGRWARLFNDGSSIELTGGVVRCGSNDFNAALMCSMVRPCPCKGTSKAVN